MSWSYITVMHHLITVTVHESCQLLSGAELTYAVFME